MPKVKDPSPDRLDPVHPGEILLHDFMEPLKLSQHRLALETGIPVSRINAIVKCDRSLSADTALRLARFFGTTAAFWLSIQMRYDLDATAIELGDRIEREVRPLARAV